MKIFYLILFIFLSGCAEIQGVKADQEAAKNEQVTNQALVINQTNAQKSMSAGHAQQAQTNAAKMIAPLTY